jgi:hypothetical protein
MKPTDARSFVLSLRAWLDDDQDDHKLNRLAMFVIERALHGHFGYFKLLLDLVDGPVTPRDEKCDDASHCIELIAKEARDSELVRAA